MTTTEAGDQGGRSFVRDVLPWLVGLGAVVVYLATLNLGVRLSSLPLVAQAAGWDWRPSLFQPVFFLVTLPLRLLPESWLPAALNGLSAVCAALTLALLARSVALLPHDRLPIQRRLERSEHSLLSLPSAWMPPLLAVLVCGLQLTFWEHATLVTGMMLDLLMLAYVIRCLLEYRLEHEQTWLSRAAFVFGVGMANDWALMGFLPLFLVALIWIKGFRFFRPDFLTRMAMFGLAGLALLVLLPVLVSFSPDSPAGFWATLRLVLGSQVGILRATLRRFYSGHREVAMLLSVVALLPVTVMGIRWRRITTDNSPVGAWFTGLFFSFANLLFLLAGLWVAFDPSFSPRQRGFDLPCLPLYYLSALSVGYFSGYFLLIFGGKEPWRQPRRQPEAPPASAPGYLHAVPVLLLLVLAPVGLLIKNLPIIRSFNLPLLGQYADLALQALPRDGCIVLSDDPRPLQLLRTRLAQRGGARNYILLETQALPYAAYRAYLHRKHPQFWPTKPVDLGSEEALPANRITAMLGELSQRVPVYYLQQSFGYYFEDFYAEPHGLVYQLKPYPAGTLDAPAPTDALVAANEAFWNNTLEGAAAQSLALMADSDNAKAGWRQKFLARLKCKSELPPEVWVVAHAYSIAVDFWGVTLQRAGRLAEAARCFKHAGKLAYNRAAQVNLETNQELAAKRKMVVDLSKPPEDRLGSYRDILQLLGNDGPVDDPTLCCLLGGTFAQGQLYRQASQEFARAVALAPGCLPARFMLAELYRLQRLPDRVLTVVAQIRSCPDVQPLSPRSRVETDFLEASAHLAAGQDAEAGAVVERMLADNPGETNLLSQITRLYLTNQRYSNALAFIDRQLAADPDNVGLLINKGYVCVQIGIYSNAIPPLNRAVALQSTNSYALFNRALACLQAGDYPGAQADYETLLKLVPTSYRVYYGLAEIAWRQRQTNAAIRYYRGYLSNSVPGSDEAKLVQLRLKQLTASVH